MSSSSLPPQVKNLRVAIIGGGVCGLVCAVSLMKAGVEVQLYEASVRHRYQLAHLKRALTSSVLAPPQSKFGEVGAGVGLGTFGSSLKATATN